MLQDISTGGFGHLEMVGKVIEIHTKDVDQTPAYQSNLFAVRGMEPHFLDSQGSAWTATYIQEGGDVVRDLRANISSEVGARRTYEALIKLSTDDGTKTTLHHLLTRDFSYSNFHQGFRFSGRTY